MRSCKIPLMFLSLPGDLDRNFVSSSRINRTGWKSEPRITRPPSSLLPFRIPMTAIQTTSQEIPNIAKKRFIGRPRVLGGHEADLGRGCSRRSDKGRLGLGAVLRIKVRFPGRARSQADSFHRLAMG